MDLDQLPDAVFELDADRRLRSVNRAAEELTGFPAEAMLGRSTDELLDPRPGDGQGPWDGGWHPSAHLRTVGRIPEHEVRLRGADGGDVAVMVTGRYRREPDGRLTGAVVVARHGARRRQATAEGIEVVSTVSHELRAPLTSVRGFTSLLINRWDRLGDDQKRAMLEQVHHDAGRVTRLIGELLDISRLESGRLALRRQLVDVPALAGDVLEKVRMTEPELDAEVEFPSEFPRIFADPDKIEQVLTNLVENAAKYGSPKGMRISGDVNDDMVSVSVTDQGEGIAASDLRQVFTKFFRRAETRPTGSGLGLWISRGLVEAHGGRLVVESEIGQGSVFRFSLPVGLTEDRG